jgi:hypothetical protein
VTTLIGWDAAVDPRNNALIRGVFHRDGPAGKALSVEDLVRPATRDDLIATLSGWIEDADPSASVLICADSPLGWPAGLGPVLSSHRAGAGISLDAERLFRRHTDRDIRQRLGKTPLDVGADRIARTAVAVLNVVGEVTASVPTIRRPTIAVDERSLRDGVSRQGVLLIETYPAGWFASEGITTRGYRPSAGISLRRRLLGEAIDAFQRTGIAIRSAVDEESLVERADDLDALVCVFAGVDALRGNAPGPAAAILGDVAVEGWIWCKSRS